MRNQSDLAKLKTILSSRVSDDYIDERCDSALVVTMVSQLNEGKLVSMLFSRETVAINKDPAASPQFEAAMRYVANISMSEDNARRLAVNILKGLGDSIEEIQHPDDSSDAGE
ncbi:MULTISPECIES: hypothetical protein [Pseudomonas]|uniref:hypothetical protein n=1 Tax=Pseudomonas TaxID=286 RepID=UPI0014738A67|nr:hypothetical protein [Pseudomonas gessardii]NNA69463.1 hypothetical protein [Pseudomonas gessardii]